MKLFTTLAVALLIALPLVGCTVEQTEEARLPDVDVDVEVEKGQLPKYDVDTAEIEIGLEKKTVEVPDVDVEVNKKEVEVTLPDIDIDMPDEKNKDDSPDDDGGDS